MNLLDHLFLAGSLPFWNPRHVPSGSSQGQEDRYFNYLWKLDFINGPHQQVNVQWASIITVALWIGVLVLLAYLLTNGSYHEQNKRGLATDPNGPEIQDLYPVEAYNGIITERNGAVDKFNYFLYAIVIAFAVGLMLSQILNGQVYG